jgi:hypothetical protein
MKEDRRIAAEKKADLLRREMFALIQDCRDYNLNNLESAKGFVRPGCDGDPRLKVQGTCLILLVLFW